MCASTRRSFKWIENPSYIEQQGGERHQHFDAVNA